VFRFLLAGPLYRWAYLLYVQDVQYDHASTFYTLLNEIMRPF